MWFKARDSTYKNRDEWHGDICLYVLLDKRLDWIKNTSTGHDFVNVDDQVCGETAMQVMYVCECVYHVCVCAANKS